MINIVWLKRDLRLTDHAPLQAAVHAGTPFLILYIFEPSMMHAPDYDVRHARFVWQSLQDIKAQLANKEALCIVKEEVVPVFEVLHQTHQIHTLFSHQETGNAISFERDKAVGRWCRKSGVVWQEFSDRGIIRGLKIRDNWPKHWYGVMQSPIIKSQIPNSKPVNPPEWNIELHHWQDLYPQEPENQPRMQPGGTTKGKQYLHSFLEERSRNYQKHISKPEASRRGCSRLSPYLAYGCLSLREVYQATGIRRQEFDAPKRPLTAFLDRLRWHSHFMQKMESKPSIEFENTNPGYNGIRTDADHEKINAWREGRTGYPMVDACMLCLKETGYVNFRMRAMLVSFLTHHLWQPWQAGVHHLAQYFLDYEPGIHFPQFQMQAGVTGINTIRIYNPVKQGTDHDPDGAFVKKWIPVLENIPPSLIHCPWQQTKMAQQEAKCILGEDYPLPVVNLEAAAKHAREQLWCLKNSKQVRQHNKEVLGTLSDRNHEEQAGA